MMRSIRNTRAISRSAPFQRAAWAASLVVMLAASVVQGQMQQSRRAADISRLDVTEIPNSNEIIIVVDGAASSSPVTYVGLEKVYYPAPPQDGIQDFMFNVKSGPFQVLEPIRAPAVQYDLQKPFIGIRIHASNGTVEWRRDSSLAMAGEHPFPIMPTPIQGIHQSPGTIIAGLTGALQNSSASQAESLSRRIGCPDPDYTRPSRVNITTPATVFVLHASRGGIHDPDIIAKPAIDQLLRYVGPDPNITVVQNHYERSGDDFYPEDCDPDYYVRGGLDVDRYKQFTSELVACVGGIYSLAFEWGVEDILEGWEEHLSGNSQDLVLVFPADAIYCTGAYVPGRYQPEVYRRMRARGHSRILLSEAFEILGRQSARREYVERFLDNVRFDIPDDCGVQVFVSRDQIFRYRDKPNGGKDILVIYDDVAPIDGGAERVQTLMNEPAAMRKLFEAK